MKAKVKTWLRNVDNGNIRNFTEKVLNEIKKNSPNKMHYDLWKETRNGISTYELRECLGMSHQTLTSRLSELTDNGLIKCIGQTEVMESTYSVYMFIYDTEYRNRLVTLRKKEKYLQWLKKADDYSEFMDNQTATMISYEQDQNQIL